MCLGQFKPSPATATVGAVLPPFLKIEKKVPRFWKYLSCLCASMYQNSHLK